MLTAGTHDGIYRVSGIDEPGEFEYEKVLDTNPAMHVWGFDALDGVFAATRSGLYRSLNGDDWTDLGVPHEEVYSVVATPAGERLYAGTHPAHLYACTAFSGDNATGPTECDWHEVDGFQDLPSRDEWYTPHHRNEAHIRSLGTHPDAPGRLVAGAEAGGVHLSDDDGETWGERTADVPDDIHHLLVRGADEYIASTGFGLHRTTDAGRSWTRLDEGIEQRYFPEATDHDGILYTSAAMGPSPHWDDGADAVLLEPRNERTFEAVDLPRPDEVVLAWTVVDGEVIAGTNDGTLLTQRGDEWTTSGLVSSEPGDAPDTARRRVDRRRRTPRQRAGS